MNEQVKPDQAPQQGFIGGILVGIGTKIVANRVGKALDKALDKVEASPNIPINTKEDSDAIKVITKKEVMKEVGPLIENLQNQEPLWRSKVLWFSLGTIVTSVAGIVRLYTNGTPDEIEAYMGLATTGITAAGAIVSRIFPSKALGR